MAREGAKYNIKTNVIVPVSTRQRLLYHLTDGQMAASAMTETILPPDMLKGLKPEFIAPFVGVLTAKNVSDRARVPAVADCQGPDVTGRIFELGAGFFSEVRWERSKGQCRDLFFDRCLTIRCNLAHRR